MAFDREAAKADGYTDEEIDQYLATKDQPLPPDQPRDRTEEQIGTATSMIPSVGSVAGDVAKYGLEFLAAKKFIVDPLMNRGAPPAPPVAAPAPPVAAPTPPVAAPVGPAAPAAPKPVTFTGGANPAWDEALSRPHPSTQPPNMMQRGMDYAKQMQRIAAEKVMQGARAVAPYAQAAGEGMATAGRAAAPYAAPVAVGAASLFTPGNAGQNYGAQFPQSGPYRGMEINPRTGRPWTPQELAQYR